MKENRSGVLPFPLLNQKSSEPLDNKLVVPILSTPKELAEILRVSPKTIYYWVTRNEIPFVRVGRHIRFIIQDVMAHFSERTGERAPACLQRSSAIQNGFSGSLKSGHATRLGSFASSTKE